MLPGGLSFKVHCSLQKHLAGRGCTSEDGGLVQTQQTAACSQGSKCCRCQHHPHCRKADADSFFPGYASKRICMARAANGRASSQSDALAGKQMRVESGALSKLA